MFRGIGIKLRERAELVDHTKLIQRAVTAITTQYRVSVQSTYDPQKDALYIEAHTKAGASELLLHASDITSFLRQTLPTIKRIIIR